MLGGMGNVYLILWETANIFPSDCTILHSYQQSMSIPSSALGIVSFFFYFSYYGKSVVVSHNSFNLYLPGE